MPTPWTEGNGCKYCDVKEMLVGSADPFKASEVKKTYLCMCQAPEIQDCPHRGLQTAMNCEYFKSENEEFDIYLKQLKETIANSASNIPAGPYENAGVIGTVMNKIVSEDGVTFDLKLNQNLDDIFKDCNNDPVNHPSHYTSGGIECIDAVMAALSCHDDPINAWLTGQCLKYLWRWPLKNGLEDLKKCQFYLNKLIERMEK